jgi:molybdate transport system substrate-binding protein
MVSQSGLSDNRYVVNYITNLLPMFDTLLRLCAGLGALLLSALAAAGEVKVAVAANFALPLERIGAGFTAATGHRLKVSPGSTGKLYSQILAGAPFEVLLAADAQTPQKLVADGQAVAGSRFTYAIGRLVLWSPRPGRVDAEGAVLRSSALGKLAIANPQTAPYGAAALQVLQALGLADALRPRLVTGESIAQTFQFVASGNAELGFVALSQIAAPGQALAGSYWQVPAELHSEIRQDAVLLAAGASNPAAVAFLDYLKSPTAREVIRSFGYGP